MTTPTSPSPQAGTPLTNAVLFGRLCYIKPENDMKVMYDHACQLETRLAAMRRALEQSQNTIRSLIHTLETIDSDERSRARDEGRSAYVHTIEIRQAKEAHALAESALSATKGEA